MPRLPTVNGDNSAWGAILNSFLGVAHNADGSIKNLFFNVKDPAYGAVGNGVVDDTTAIQVAINACNAVGGGIVYFPYGTYLISSKLIVGSDNVHLLGASWGVQLLAKSGFAAGPMLQVQAPGGAGNFRYGIKLTDLFLNGNNLTGVGGIELDSTYMAVIDHCRIRYCPGTGIYLTDPSSGGARGAYTTIRDTDITDGGAGTAILSAYSENWRVLGGLIAFYNTSGGVGIKNQDGGCTIDGTQFDECDTSVWQFFANSNQTVNCSFGRAVSRHIYLNGSKRNIVANNYFDQCVGTPSPAAIIYADNGANASNVIADNTYIGTVNGWTYAYYEAGGIGTPGNTITGNAWNGLAVQSFNGSAQPLIMSVNTPDPGNGGTISTVTGVAGDVARVTPTANETGIILQAGTQGGQVCKVINNSASFSIQFAASGTSHVAMGAGLTISANGKYEFVWDSALSLWY